MALIPQLIAAFSFAQKIPYGKNAAVGKYYEVRGIKLYVEEYGSGPPLLMIHGNGGDMSAFSENVPYFAKKYRVILVDSRSQGKSKDPRTYITFEQMADDFAVLLNALHIPKAYVLGWSDGGINAILMAIRHPDKVIKFASTGANITADAAAFGNDGWAGSQKYYNDNKNKIRRTAAEKNAWKMFMLDYEQPNIKLIDLHKIKCPAYIIAGDHDVIADKHTRLIQANIPGSKLWILKNSGHGTLIEHAAEFNKRVDAFFNEN
ncbi:alpha/beta fold hydrolase [Mucilaginibacter phyllosphaerae]|uniref:Alpha/beta hydrolase n=1 Tax=Mucilaginibacter phyllosphaerae TaxID=1812349 RepID=A0A4Y8AKU6_9SPHI|nr:alpha/beta hydrolase [Mucilaginibacter phyllosphaerae]MBB3967841.1 pimeloyl-ACP methyl ester carboxylesterase [Mucilaginibacter phyllosphaerae]TEW69115.1 alpha/beta hydrolase [Mucilaginibacter phyllosphaerae]GGH02947.1 alpha/beta hydrolase [Mucilaginibacter phyllosphaerae]